MGLLLKMNSTLQSTVLSASSSRLCALKVELSTFLTEQIRSSHAPPWCDPVGVLKVHSIPFTFTFMHLADAFIQSDLQLHSGYTFLISICVPFNMSASLICSKFHPSITRLNSCSAPTKLVPLSDRNSLTCPRLAMKRRNALMQESVSSNEATSLCTALIAKHVKITPYLFTRLLPHFTSNGPK